MGWGLAGFCPGPALVSLGAGQDKAVVFMLAMLAGMAIYEAGGTLATADSSRSRTATVTEAGSSWRQRGYVGGEHQHVVDGELFNGRLHEGASCPRSGAVLEVVELADDVVRRAAGDAGYRPKAFQVGAVTGCALDGLAVAPAGGERLPLLDAANRDVSDENGMRVPAYEPLQIFRAPR